MIFIMHNDHIIVIADNLQQITDGSQCGIESIVHLFECFSCLGSISFCLTILWQ